MHIDNFATGEIAEDLASALLKPYFAIGSLRPDPGMDLVGYYRRSNPLQAIVFQVKNARRFRFKSAVLINWLAQIHRQPVILIRIEVPSSRPIRYSFVVLHDWMLENPNWLLRLLGHGSLGICLDEFVTIDDDRRNLLAAVETEISRVTRDGSSLWTARQWRGLPISEPEIFSHFGRLSRLELNVRMLEEMTKQGIPSWQERQCRMILEELKGPPGTIRPSAAEWADEVAPDIDGELEAFRQFVAAMRSFSRGSAFQLPETSWRAVSSWRTFCQVFPKSLNMLNAFLTEPRRWVDSPPSLGTAFILVATLANIEDSVLAEQAREVLAHVSGEFLIHRASNYAQYCAIATYYATCCEAGDARDASRCLDFHLRHEEEWQIRWQRAYYEGDDLASARAAFHKLTLPKLRHLKTRDLEEWRLKVLMEHGVQLTSL